MEINKNNLHLLIGALKQCVKENEGKFTSTGHIVIPNICEDTIKYLESILPFAETIDEMRNKK